MKNCKHETEIINTKYKLKGSDAEYYFIKKFKNEGYECCKSMSSAVINNYAVKKFLANEKYAGIPDLVVFNSEQFFFVEVKNEKDKLRESQIKWIKEHPRVKVLVYHLKQNIIHETYDEWKLSYKIGLLQLLYVLIVEATLLYIVISSNKFSFIEAISLILSVAWAILLIYPCIVNLKRLLKRKKRVKTFFDFKKKEFPLYNN